MLEYGIIGISLTIISVVGLFLLYRKTDETLFLILGAVIYLKLLFATFNLISEFAFLVPEFLLTVQLVGSMFKSHIKWAIGLIMVLIGLYIPWIVYTPYPHFGLPGFIFLIICSVWYFKIRE
jgi:hypothetical protein